MELNSLLLLLEAAEYLERRDRGIWMSVWSTKTIFVFAIFLCWGRMPLTNLPADQV